MSRYFRYGREPNSKQGLLHVPRQNTLRRVGGSGGEGWGCVRQSPVPWDASRDERGVCGRPGRGVRGGVSERPFGHVLAHPRGRLPVGRRLGSWGGPLRRLSDILEALRRQGLCFGVTASRPTRGVLVLLVGIAGSRLHGDAPDRGCRAFCGFFHFRLSSWSLTCLPVFRLL